eukprot:COSAG01_NODE_22087_length_872_cov_1.445019_1_plen_40_part_01
MSTVLADCCCGIQSITSAGKNMCEDLSAAASIQGMLQQGF